MNLGQLRARSLRERLVLLLLPLLAFRLLVPEGFMPSFGDGLEISMQMCHGDAKSSVVVRLTGGGTDGAPAAPDASHEAPCVFAAASGAALQATIVVPLPGATSPDPVPAPRVAAPAPRTPHRPQSPRAPPSLV
jgi:hypothetical protein